MTGRSALSAMSDLLPLQADLRELCVHPMQHAHMLPSGSTAQQQICSKHRRRDQAAHCRYLGVTTSKIPPACKNPTSALEGRAKGLASGSDLVFCLALADGDYKLTESAVVVEYLDKKYGKAGKSLLPDDAEQLGKVGKLPCSIDLGGVYLPLESTGRPGLRWLPLASEPYLSRLIMKAVD